MRKVVVPTYMCYFVVGSNKGYDTDTFISKDELIQYIQSYQRNTRLDACSVNVCTGNQIVFGPTDYAEECYRVEVIQYPRFKKAEKKILAFMLELAEYLLVNLEQKRISVITPEDTIMLEA